MVARCKKVRPIRRREARRPERDARQGRVSGTTSGEVATTFHVPRDRAVETLGGGGERRQTWRLRRGAGTIERAPEQSTWMSFSERVPYRKSLRRGRSQKVTRSKYQRDRRADPRWAAKTVDGTSAGTRFWRGVSEHYITSITSLSRRTDDCTIVGALSFFGVEIPTYPALGAAARPGPYQHTPARRVGVEAPHTYIPRRAAWVWKRRIPTYPPKGA